MKRREYAFDVRRGHFRRLDEDGQPQTAGQAAAGSGGSPAQTVTTDADKVADGISGNDGARQAQVPANKSVESDPDVQKADQARAAEDKRYGQEKSSLEQKYQSDRSAQQDILNAALAAAGNNAEPGAFDSVQTSAAVLDARKKLLDLDLKHAQDAAKSDLAHAQNVYKIETDRLQVLKRMASEGLDAVPEKYRGMIAGGTLSRYKTYLGDLLEDDDVVSDAEVREMLAGSGLLWGRDSRGRYAVCADADDGRRLAEALVRAGADADAAKAVVWSQSAALRG